MQIGVADPAGFDFDQHVARAGTRHVDFLDQERLAETPQTAAFIVLSIERHPAGWIKLVRTAAAARTSIERLEGALRYSQ